ncbi:hypothetical protein F4818DRAFT_238516 [Hypoxylon cercidicola]|nr:hypothetical protein F4818DRAFT_238516 [Hypoxylon cercidicola]
MGRLAPWVKYRLEWEQIRDQKKERGILEGKPDTEGSLIPGPSPEVEQRYKWMPQLLSASLGLSDVKSYSDQSECPLFKLPVELRFAVWEDVVGGNDVTIVRKVNKLAHAVLPRDEARLDAAETVTPGSVFGPSGSQKRIKADQVTAEANLLAMLQSCKRLYLEALPVLYGRNSFEFRTMESFYRFLLHAPMAGLQSIRSININWTGFAYWQHYEYDAAGKELELELEESWREICSAILAMKSLKDLHFHSWLEFKMRSERTSREDMIQRILAPLKELPEDVKLTYTFRRMKFTIGPVRF